MGSRPAGRCHLPVPRPAEGQGWREGPRRRSARLGDAVKASDFDNLDLLPADFSYRNLDLLLNAEKKPTRKLGRLLDGLAEEYDVVILDCAPSVSLVSENIVRAADLVLAPVLPAPLSVRTLDQLTSFIADTKGPSPRCWHFLSMVDRRRKLHRQLAAELPEERDDFAEAVIPVASAVEQMGVRRSPVVAWAPGSPAAKAFRSLWSETVTRWH